MKPETDEWAGIETLLPQGWIEAARATKAFRRIRYTPEPRALLRLLLFHAVSGTAERETVKQAAVAGIAKMSQVALWKRLRKSGRWLEWIARALCEELRASLPDVKRRVRAVDSTAISKPGSEGTDWRLHYAIDLRTLQCDWHQLTDRKGGESLGRTTVKRGDILLGDRNYLHPKAVAKVVRGGADVLVRLRWTHSAMVDDDGHEFLALDHARPLGIGQVGEWNVQMAVEDQDPISGRVVVLRLPADLAARAEGRAAKGAAKKSRKPGRRTLEAAQFVMLFTTIQKKEVRAEQILDLYRCRWQIELAFKRLKQLLKIGNLPHRDDATAQSWIAGKIVVALLLERLFRNARALSPWGYERRKLTQPT